MTTSERLPVVISGGGPVGLTLALLLHRQGVKAVVLEKKVELDPHSRATLLVPHTMQVFHDLELLDEFVTQGQRNDAIRLLRTPDRKQLFNFSFDRLAQKTVTPFALALSQDHTEQILFDAARQAGIDVRMGDNFDHFEVTPQGVRVHHGGGEPIEASLLVGCDGAHSGVRDQLGWELEGKTYNGRALLVDVRIADEADTEAGWLTDPTNQSFLFTIRFGKNIWRIIEADIHDDVADDQLADRAQHLATRLFGAGACRETLWFSAYRKHERRSDRYVDGRVVLAGDAAHLNSPAGGQGLNAGIGDAERLAHAIVTGLDGDLAAELASYERERTTFFDKHVRPLTDSLEHMETASPWARRLIVGAAELARYIGFEHFLAHELSMLP